MEVGKNLLGIEGEVAWATPGAFTIHNFPCAEDGKNCNGKKKVMQTQHYVDPSKDMDSLFARVALDKEQALEKKKLMKESEKRTLRA